MTGLGVCAGTVTVRDMMVPSIPDFTGYVEVFGLQRLKIKLHH